MALKEYWAHSGSNRQTEHGGQVICPGMGDQEIETSGAQH